MIKGTFEFGGDNVEVIVRGEELLFFDIDSQMITPISGLKLSKQGCIKEFPDLKDDEDWKKKTIERFKEKMKTYRTENERIEYVAEELKKQGYIPLFKQRAGWRARKF